MGSTASQLLGFLPGAAMTAGGALSGNPMLATAGATNLAGVVPGLSGGQSPDQQMAAALASNPSLRGISPGMVMGLGPGSPALPATSGGFGNIGNTFASVAAPLLGVGGAMMANRAQMPPAGVPSAPAPRAPVALNQQPVGPAQTVPPMTALAAYRQMLSGGGNG